MMISDTCQPAAAPGWQAGLAGRPAAPGTMPLTEARGSAFQITPQHDAGASIRRGTAESAARRMVHWISRINNGRGRRQAVVAHEHPLRRRGRSEPCLRKGSWLSVRAHHHRRQRQRHHGEDQNGDRQRHGKPPAKQPPDDIAHKQQRDQRTRNPRAGLGEMVVKPISRRPSGDGG